MIAAPANYGYLYKRKPILIAYVLRYGAAIMMSEQVLRLHGRRSSKMILSLLPGGVVVVLCLFVALAFCYPHEMSPLHRLYSD